MTTLEQRPSPTINALCDAYVADRFDPYAHRPCKTPESIVSHLIQVRAFFGPMTIADLNSEEPGKDTETLVRDAVKQWREGGISKSTCHKRITLMKAALHHGVRRKLLKRDDLPFIYGPGQGEPRERFLDRETEWPRLREALDDPDTPDHVRTFTYLQLAGAQRCGATLALTWDEVDFLQGVIFYKRTGGAANKRRVNIPMRGRLIELLLAAKKRARCNHVIEWNAKPVRKIHHGFQAAVKRAGIVDLRIHDLRRSSATFAFMDGVPLDVVAAWLGDNPAIVRKHYAHVVPEFLGQAADALDRVIA